MCSMTSVDGLCSNGYGYSNILADKIPKCNTTASGIQVLSGWPSVDGISSTILPAGATASSSSPGSHEAGAGSPSQYRASVSSPFPVSPERAAPSWVSEQGQSKSPFGQKREQRAAVLPHWVDLRRCSFCHVSSGSGASYPDPVCGRMIPLPDDSFAHVNCIRWSSEVVERAGRLVNVADAKQRSARVYCALCSQRGATVGCMVKECKRSFHLRCAVAAHCTLMETKLPEDTDSSVEGAGVKSNEPHEVFTLVACPEHFHKIDRNRITRRWRPSEPLRLLSADGGYEM
jgi:PHD-like zinc-binding domain